MLVTVTFATRVGDKPVELGTPTRRQCVLETRGEAQGPQPGGSPGPRLRGASWRKGRAVGRGASGLLGQNDRHGGRRVRGVRSTPARPASVPRLSIPAFLWEPTLLSFLVLRVLEALTLPPQPPTPTPGPCMDT